MIPLPLELEAIDAISVALGNLSLADYEIPDVVSVFKRPLNQTDPNLSVGVVFHSWMPRDRPNIGSNEPAIGRYRYTIQTFVKSGERELGERLSAVLTKRLRNVLYRDPTLRAALGALREEDDFSPIERVLKYGVEQTEYADSPFSGGFAFLSQTEFYLETEVA